MTWVPVSRKRLRSRALTIPSAGGQPVRGLARGPGGRPSARRWTTPPSLGSPMPRLAGPTCWGSTRPCRRTVRDKRLLLIDDIVTTGSTLTECVRVLREAGARRRGVPDAGSHREDALNYGNTLRRDTAGMEMPQTAHKAPGLVCGGTFLKTVNICLRGHKTGKTLLQNAESAFIIAREESAACSRVP